MPPASSGWLSELCLTGHSRGEAQEGGFKHHVTLPQMCSSLIQTMDISVSRTCYPGPHELRVWPLALVSQVWPGQGRARCVGWGRDQPGQALAAAAKAKSATPS